MARDSFGEGERSASKVQGLVDAMKLGTWGCLASLDPSCRPPTSHMGSGCPAPSSRQTRAPQTVISGPSRMLPAPEGLHQTLQKESMAPPPRPHVPLPFHLGFIMYTCLFLGRECFQGTRWWRTWSDLCPLGAPRRMRWLITIMPPILQRALLFQGPFKIHYPI